MDCSASCIARTSAPSSRPAPKEPMDAVSSDTSDARAACVANTAKSSTSCSRLADFIQFAATRRTEVSRYARTACSGPEPPRTACSMRAKTSAVRSSAVWASRQQVRAYRRTASAWRRYSSSYAVSSPERIRSIRSASEGGKSIGGGRTPSSRHSTSRQSRCAGTVPSEGFPAGGTPARPPWLGTCGDVSPLGSASPSPSDSSRPSTPIAESPRRQPNPSRTRARVPYWLLFRTRRYGPSTRPWRLTARQY
jgi:hypothetical protein